MQDEGGGPGMGASVQDRGVPGDLGSQQCRMGGGVQGGWGVLTV